METTRKVEYSIKSMNAWELGIIILGLNAVLDDNLTPMGSRDAVRNLKEQMDELLNGKD